MTEQPNVYQGKRGITRVWRCDVCRRLFEWNPAATWHGSRKDVDDGNWEKIRVMCSTECFELVGEREGGRND